MSKKTAAVLAAYKTKENLFVRFNPDRQDEMALREDAYYNDLFPNLWQLKEAFGENAPLQWLSIQINAVAKSMNVREMTDYQVKMCASSITAHYGFLKISELMVFFSDLRGGQFGHFYGAVDPGVITSHLHDFVEYGKRNRIIEEHQRAIENKTTTEVCSQEEYIRLKAEKNEWNENDYFQPNRGLEKTKGQENPQG